MKGLVIKAIGEDFTVAWRDERITCRSRGNLKYKSINIKVGDKVEFDGDERIITNVGKRKNSIVRPSIANADKVIIIISVKEPDLNMYLLDKTITIFEMYDIPANIVFTKTDLLTKEELIELRKIQDYYEEIGYYTYLSTKTTIDEKIFEEISGSISIITGQSGAGKTTYLNNLNKKLNLKTGEISKALNKGKNTTGHVELFEVGDGWVADSPGFSTMELPPMSLQTLNDMFREMWKEGRYCRYNDCRHVNEPHCRIKQMVSQGLILQSRYDNYLKFLEEVKEINKKNNKVF